MRDFVTPEGKTAAWIFLHLTAINNRFKLGVTPSYKTVSRRCRALDAYRRNFQRGGKRFAEKWRPVYPKNILLGSHTGVKSWQQAHCDSTAFDLLHEDNGKVTRFHLIKMVDSFDGRVLCHCLTEDAPSEKTARQLLITCADRHRLLPATITFDWGPEGRSTWLQTTLEELGVTVIFRPKAAPRSGSNVETMFRKLCVDLLHNLKGTTKLLQKARMITRAVDPRDRAVWTGPAVRELLEEYYELVNDLPRRNRRAPNRVAQESIARYGMPPTQVPEPNAFRWALLPLVDGTTRKVSPRGVVRCNDRGYYHNELRRYDGKLVQVRYDEGDIQHVYVTLPDQGRRTVVCEVVDTALKYATPEDALRIQKQVREELSEARTEIIARKAEFVARVNRKEKAETAASKRRRTPPKSMPATQSQPPQRKIVSMPLAFKWIIGG
jgi:transposase InsO family protein